MNEDVLLSRQRISRRRALSLGGTVGLGGLLAACGLGGDGTPTATGSATGSEAATGSPTPTSAAAAGSATLAGADVVAMLDAANTCTLAREETQGPYWFDVDSIRTDIREDRPGTPFALALRVQDISACSAGAAPTPVPSCVVELWHCDAGGAYSGFESGSSGGAGARGGGAPAGGSEQTSDGSYSAGDTEAQTTDDGTYLRGAQVADAGGIVRFTTIYPGWYRGRTPHIHLKVHVDKTTVLTSQLFMDDTLSDSVYATSPYAEHTGRDTTNADDSIFDAAGLLTVEEQDDGYLGVINLGIDV